MNVICLNLSFSLIFPYKNIKKEKEKRSKPFGERALLKGI
jgi:hypothetical protein